MKAEGKNISKISVRLTCHHKFDFKTKRFFFSFSFEEQNSIAYSVKASDLSQSYV